MPSLKILFIGDIVGQLGRQAIKQVVPQLRREYNLDLVIANVENLAHGKGITQKTLAEIDNSGIDIFTSGNHIWRRKEGVKLLADQESKILRPANYPPGVPGRGFIILTVKNKKVLVVNLIGRVFMSKDYDDPFRKFDEILSQTSGIDEVIVDLHAEASSEKKAFGWYAAGRASLVVGTHTHVPTADAGLISKHNLGYVTDVGMVAARDGILGVKKEEIIKSFLTQLPVGHKMLTKGKISFNSVFAKIDNHKTIQIKRIDLEIEGR
jgi:metallophosphoesterase (TIGR00282 family)